MSRSFLSGAFLLALGLAFGACERIQPQAPPPPSQAEKPTAPPPLGSVAGLVPSTMVEEERPAVQVNVPLTVTIPPTTGTLTDGRHLTLTVVLELDLPESQIEAQGRVHEFQDLILKLVADRSAAELLNSFAQEDLRFAIYDSIRLVLPPRGLKKVYLTEFRIQ